MTSSNPDGASVRASSAISAKVGGTTTMRGRGMGELNAELAIGARVGGGGILQQEKRDLNQASPYRRRCAKSPTGGARGRLRGKRRASFQGYQPAVGTIQ